LSSAGARISAASGRAEVDEEIACPQNSRIAHTELLGPDLLEETPGRDLLAVREDGVFKITAGARCSPSRLSFPAALQVIPDRFPDPFRISGNGLQDGAQDDGGTRFESRVTIAEGHVLPGERTLRAVVPQATPPEEDVAHRPPERPGVAVERAADGSRDAGQEIEPVEAPVKSVLKQATQGGAGQDGDFARLGPGDDPLGPVADDEAPIPFIGEQDVIPPADDIPGDTCPPGESDRYREIFARLRLEKEVGRAPSGSWTFPQGDALRRASRRPPGRRRYAGGGSMVFILARILL
jgi:hypothetical protein